MSDNSKIDKWIRDENLKTLIMKEIQAAPLTRNELMQMLGISSEHVGGLIRNLYSRGYIKKIKAAPCSVSGYNICRYIPTDLKYTPRDAEARKNMYEQNAAYRARRRELKQLRASGKPTSTRKSDPLTKSTDTVIKVNEYTTIYLNSQRPQSDFAIKKEQKSRRHSKVAIGSGIDMFGNW